MTNVSSINHFLVQYLVYELFLNNQDSGPLRYTAAEYFLHLFHLMTVATSSAFELWVGGNQTVIKQLKFEWAVGTWKHSYREKSSLTI